MKAFVRLIALAAAVFALSGIRGAEAVQGDDEANERQVNSQSSLFSAEDRGQEDADWCNRSALIDGGLEFSAARTVSPASRVRSFSEERNNSPQHSRTGFFRSGKTVCTARPCNFMMDRITSPVSGALSGLSSAVALERLRI